MLDFEFSGSNIIERRSHEKTRLPCQCRKHECHLYCTRRAHFCADPPAFRRRPESLAIRSGTTRASQERRRRSARRDSHTRPMSSGDNSAGLMTNRRPSAHRLNLSAMVVVMRPPGVDLDWMCRDQASSASTDTCAALAHPLSTDTQPAAKCRANRQSRGLIQ